MYKIIIKNRVVYEIMWKNILKPCTSQIIIWPLLIASWIS